MSREVRVVGGNPDIVDYANGKHNVRAKAIELGVPVPDGDIVEVELGGDGRPLNLKPLKRVSPFASLPHSIDKARIPSAP